MNLARKLLEILLKIHFIKDPNSTYKESKPQFSYEHYFVKDFFNKNISIIVEKLKWIYIEIVESNLELVLNELNDSDLVFGRPAVEDHEQNKYHDDVLNLLIDLYRNGLEEIVTSLEAKSFVQKLFKRKNVFY